MWGSVRKTVKLLPHSSPHGARVPSTVYVYTNRNACHCAAITFGPPSETSGEARGFSFVYSGNFLVEAELSEMGRLRCCIGMNPMGLQWHLLPGIMHRAVRVLQ
jgi:alpha-galactosidase